MQKDTAKREVHITAGTVILEGSLTVPEGAVRNTDQPLREQADASP